MNVVGVQEAAKLSITLAVVDFATQVLLVIVGFALVLSPETLVENGLGHGTRWNLAISIPVAMLAYTGVETVSNLAEEARDPVRTVPGAYKLVAGAVFAIYFTLPLVALSALPVEEIDGELTTIQRPPEEGGFANDPILGVVENLGLEGLLLDAAEIYVGVLAATILFIATNAGSSAHRGSRTRWPATGSSPRRCAGSIPASRRRGSRSCSSPGSRRSSSSSPGTSTSSERSTRWGDALVHGRAPSPSHACGCSMERAQSRVPSPNVRVGGVSWPLFALGRAVATGASFLVLVVRRPPVGRPGVDGRRARGLRRLPERFVRLRCARS